MHPAPLTGFGAKRSRGRHATRHSFGHKGVVSSTAMCRIARGAKQKRGVLDRRTEQSIAFDGKREGTRDPIRAGGHLHFVPSARGRMDRAHARNDAKALAPKRDRPVGGSPVPCQRRGLTVGGD